MHPGLDCPVMPLPLTRSKALLRRARKLMPGGVSSPVRAHTQVAGTPPFIVRGRGAYLEDADGNRYLDYVGSWGPLILGHAPPVVMRALRRAAAAGTSFGAPTELEVLLAAKICGALPGIEQLRFVCSGTEAVMSALRLARAATGRSRILKFEGGYHGHADALLLEAGSGVATLGIPASPGVPEAFTRLTVQAPYNDLSALAGAFKRYGDELAAVIVEPVAGNMGCIPPGPGFLEGLREICDRHGALLIFDEVMTGFRVAWGGAQRRYSVTPDLTCLGKIIGGGLPAAAYGGRRALMEQVAPSGPVYQAGTLAGNPLAMAAGLATLEALEKPGAYKRLERRSAELTQGLQERAAAAGVELCCAAVGGLFGFFFHEGPVRNFDDARRADPARFRVFFRAMLEQGVYLAPSPFEAGFVSLAHRRSDIRATLEKAGRAFEKVARMR